jgi:hypothetical protein
MWLTLYPTPIELREVLQYITKPAPEDEAFAKNLLRLAVSTLKYGRKAAVCNMSKTRDKKNKLKSIHKQCSSGEFCPHIYPGISDFHLIGLPSIRTFFAKSA